MPTEFYGETYWRESTLKVQKEVGWMREICCEDEK